MSAPVSTDGASAGARVAGPGVVGAVASPRDFASRFVRAGELVFDVGANVGERSALYLSLGARVVAVEPQPRLAAGLRERFAGEPGFTLIEAGLGASAGEAELAMATYHTVASMSPEWVRRVRASGRFEGIDWPRTIRVPVTTFDELIVRFGVPAFAKIDVEGFEDQVLAGLSRAPEALSFEFTPEHADSTGRCIDRLESIARARFVAYEYNLGLGEHTQLAMTTWVSAEVLRARLAGFRDDRVVFGDVYARLRGVGRGHGGDGPGVAAG